MIIDLLALGVFLSLIALALGWFPGQRPKAEGLGQRADATKEPPEVT